MGFVIVTFVTTVTTILLSLCLASLRCTTFNARTVGKFFITLLSGIVGWCCILYFFNPSHETHRFLMSKHGAPYIWGETVIFEPANLFKPTSLEELQVIVHNSRKCRVIGSGHSFSPLVQTDEDLIDICHLKGIIRDDGTHITAWAGSTIEDVQLYLTQRGRTLHGFGSIHSQTLAGGLSTSLVGIQPVGFSSQCTWAQTVNANGDIVEWADTYFLRNSMGLLGIITQLQFKTYPNFWTTHIVKRMSLDSLLYSWKNTHAAAIDSATTMKKIRADALVVTTISTRQNMTKPTEYPKYWTQTNYILYDMILTPISFFISEHFHFMLEMSIYPRDTETALLGFDTKQFGQTYTDYVIPLENCSKALREMAQRSRYDTLVRIKYLSEYNMSCLDVTQSPSCRIEAYAGQHHKGIYNDIEKYQAIAVKYNGFVHWGKIYMGNIQQQMQRFKCFDAFKTLQTLHDPTRKFVNAFLNGSATKYTTYTPTYARVYAGLFLFALFVVSVFTNY